MGHVGVGASPGMELMETVNMDWHDRRTLEDMLVEGAPLTTAQCESLIQDGDEGEQAIARLEALERAIAAELGYELVDVTTDDDEEVRLQFVPVEHERAQDVEHGL